MAFKFLLFLVAAVGAASLHEHQSQSQQQQRQRQSTDIRDHNEDGPVGYDFSYSVQDPTTGDIKSQEESRRNGNVRGQYSWVDADGTRQIVEYQADDRNGFHSEHRREPAQRAHHVVQIVPASLYTIDTVLAPVQSSVSRVDHHRRQHQDNRVDRNGQNDDHENRDGRDGRTDRDDRDNRDSRDGRDGRDDRRSVHDSRDDRDNRYHNDGRDSREGQSRSHNRQHDGRRGRENQSQSEVRFQDPAAVYQYSN